MTTRAEGTGLGLPIVIKILEDHGGGVDLLDGLLRDDGGRGARVTGLAAVPCVHDEEEAPRSVSAPDANEKELL